MKLELNDLSDKKIINIIRDSGYTQLHVSKVLEIHHTYLCILFAKMELTKKVRRNLIKFIETYNLY